MHFCPFGACPLNAPAKDLCHLPRQGRDLWKPITPNGICANPWDLWENKNVTLLHVTCYNKVVPHVAQPSFALTARVALSPRLFQPFLPFHISSMHLTEEPLEHNYAVCRIYLSLCSERLWSLDNMIILPRTYATVPLFFEYSCYNISLFSFSSLNAFISSVRTFCNFSFGTISW